MWAEWKRKYDAMPPRPLRDKNWIEACSFFNSCALCGGDIDEKLLVIPPYLGGKLYTYNVLPACTVCAKRIRASQSVNPLKSFYTIKGSLKQRVDSALRYLEADMLGVALEFFDYENDSIEIIVKCTEDTSLLPFNGIYARRIYSDVGLTVDVKQDRYIADDINSVYGISWRLLDEE